MKHPLTVGTGESGRLFTLPLDLVTQTIAILARKGKGKSYLGAVFAEELLEAGQVPVIIDPTGAHWGLKSSADGREKGFPVVVFGGEHADVPLEPGAGDIVARAIVENRFPAIIDLSLMRKGETHRFLVAFLETLYRLNREPLHLICDEADVFAPQKPFGEEARTLGAMQDIVRRGRIRGIGCTLITQRPQVLNKDVLTQAEMLVALGMSHPKDIGAIEEWIAVHGDEALAKEMIASLPSLERGVAWFWAPGWGDVFEKVTIRLRQTFNSGATPKPGERVVAPKQLASVDVAKLGAEIAATVERAKDNDPAELKKKIQRLEAELKKPGVIVAAPAPVPAPEPIRVPLLTPQETRLIEDLGESVMDLAKSVQGSLTTAIELLTAINQRQKSVESQLSVRRAPIAHIAQPARQRSDAPRPSTGAGDGSPEVGTGGLRRMMIAIAQLPGINKRQLGVRAGLSSTSGTFGTYLAKLRSAGWIEDLSGTFELTSAGATALGRYEPLPEGQELLAYWLRELGDSGASKILTALAEAYPNALTKERVGEIAGMSHTSGTFGTYLSRLRTLELIEGRGELRASPELF